MSTQLSFVTVVFESERPLLRLQARSMSRFLPTDMARNIIVIDNSRTGLGSRRQAGLLRDYGPLASSVQFLRPDDIAEVPPCTGWLRQQVLKLMVSRDVDTEHYVVLDAKNHLVAPARHEFFLASDGRARVPAYAYAEHPLRDHLERVLAYLGVSGASYVERFTSTITPFVLHTETVTTMIKDLESRAGRSFPEEFVDHGLTEFFLYSGWLIAQGRQLEDVFELCDTSCPVIWPRSANLGGVKTSLGELRRYGSPFLAIHRAALARLRGSAARELASFWAEAGLFDSTRAARWFVRAFQLSLAREHVSRRLRQLR